jgi:4'-phosphopantetheinyl transferase
VYSKPAESTRPQLHPGDIHVWYFPLHVQHRDLAGLRRILSPKERRKAQRFRFEEHCNAFVLSHAVLRTVLGGYIACDPQLIEFGDSSGGKPFIKGSMLRFNLSHSDGMALIAVTLNREVGVDIERIRPMPDLNQIARDFFSAGERDDLLSLAPECRETAFYNCWTRKEAFVKAIGHGLLYPLDSFRVTLLPHQPPGFIKIGEGAAAKTEWRLHSIPPAPDYAAALAVEARDVRVHCLRIDTFAECCAYFAPPAPASTATTSSRPLP